MFVIPLNYTYYIIPITCKPLCDCQEHFVNVVDYKCIMLFRTMYESRENWLHLSSELI